MTRACSAAVARSLKCGEIDDYTLPPLVDGEKRGDQVSVHKTVAEDL